MRARTAANTDSAVAVGSGLDEIGADEAGDGPEMAHTVNSLRRPIDAWTFEIDIPPSGSAPRWPTSLLTSTECIALRADAAYQLVRPGESG